MLLIVSAQLTPEKRPIGISAALYTEDFMEAKGVHAALVRPDGFQLNASVEDERLCAKYGLSLTVHIDWLRSASEVAHTFAAWSLPDFKEMITWAFGVTGQRSYEKNPALRYVDLGLPGFDGGIDDLAAKVSEMREKGLLA
jgi:hypothetical protein